MEKRLTLEKIGVLAGVSRSTVSRVINDHPNIRPEVRQRVKTVIAQTGYQPNHAARSLASTQSRILGIVIPSFFNSLFSDPYFPRLIQGISQASNAHHYVPSLFLFNNQDEQRSVLQRVLGSGMMDGLIVTADRHDITLVDELTTMSVPFVLVGRPAQAESQGISYVDADNVSGGYNATAHLLRRGYRRIGAIVVPFNTAGQDRYAGYQQALMQHGIALDEGLIAQADFSEASGYAGMKHLLPAKPDAVFVSSDTMAFGAMRALQEAGLRVPDDVAIVGFDDLPPAHSTNPPLTTVRQPIKRTGALAVETLLDMLATSVTPERRIVLPTELVIRVSCGAVNDA
jgi:LacI family transcriptional regulator